MDLRGDEKLQTGHARSFVFPMTFGILRKPEQFRCFEIQQLRCFEGLEFSELLHCFKLRLAFQTFLQSISSKLSEKKLQPASEELGQHQQWASQPARSLGWTWLSLLECQWLHLPSCPWGCGSCWKAPARYCWSLGGEPCFVVDLSAEPGFTIHLYVQCPSIIF